MRARRLPSATELTAALLVCDRLRPHLATLMGNIGFKALLSRALALAAAENPSLLSLHIKADGSFERAEAAVAVTAPEGGAALVVQLLGLLATFIGEDLTLRLVRDVWPEALFDRSDFGKGSKNAEPK